MLVIIGGIYGVNTGDRRDDDESLSVRVLQENVSGYGAADIVHCDAPSGFVLSLCGARGDGGGADEVAKGAGVDARLVPLATPTVPVSEVAAAKGAGDDTAVLGGSSPQENHRLAPRVRDGPTPDTLPYVTAPTDICGYDWNCPQAERIVWCESRFDPLAISWTGESFGLFQIHQIHAYRWPTFWSEWMNPEVNTAWAYELWAEQGWTPWVCR